MKTLKPSIAISLLALTIITSFSNCAKADLSLAFAEDGSLIELCVGPGQTVEVPIYLIQTGVPKPNGDLTVDGIVSMGIQLQYDVLNGSATVTAAEQNSVFFEFQFEEIQNASGQAAFTGALGIMDSAVVGASIHLGTFTFQAGDPGNMTIVTTILPEIISIPGPYVVSGSTPPIVLDSLIENSMAVTTITTSFEPGDINRDRNANLLDVAPFVDLISSGIFQCEADLNQDGVVNLLDVGPFIDVLSN